MYSYTTVKDTTEELERTAAQVKSVLLYALYSEGYIEGDLLDDLDASLVISVKKPSTISTIYNKFFGNIKDQLPVWVVSRLITEIHLPEDEKKKGKDMGLQLATKCPPIPFVKQPKTEKGEDKDI